MKLVIVESPTKARTISQFLGKDYKVESSFGHIRDLPKNRLAIDVENDFEPEYIIPLKARKNVKLLKDAANKAETVILATDEDREGESIAWHLSEVLGLKNSERIVFHEITKEAINEALGNPRKIDMNLVDSQQARRVLDRIVGYKLSPFLWKKISKGLSAGRVQSVAVRLVCEKEREIEKFTAQEYWSVEAMLQKFKVPSLSAGRQSSKFKVNDFTALLVKKDGEAIDKLDIKNKEEADAIVKDLENAEYKVASVEKKEAQKNPLPPFTTSALQQEAWKRFRFPAKLTMGLAQFLYENGLITYHRTDSCNLSAASLAAARKFITENYGQNYWPGFERKFKTKSKGAQEAHEAIRPSYPDNTTEKAKIKVKMTEQQARAYDLIWRRFIACQMAPARVDSTNVEIEAENKAQNKYTFRANGQTLKFDGFLKVYPLKFTETELPELEKGEGLDLKELIPSQHFTQPPSRYTEASLIKVLEENGIGRPSTYAPIISTVQERNYIAKNEKKQFYPTEIGLTVNDLLVEHFPEVVDINFTAKLEEELDEIAEGKDQWVPTIKEFYKPFIENLNEKYKSIEKKIMMTDEKCEKCGKPMVARMGRYGQFLACSGFPDCKNTKDVAGRGNGSQGETVDNLEVKKEKCEKCGKEMIVKQGRFGKFLACSGYPECKNIKNIKKSLGPCEKCKEGEVVEKRTKTGKKFWGCSRYPKCDFATWDRPGGSD